MPQIGWFEILIIVAVAIIIIGPKDFPIMLKKIGSWIGTIKSYFNEVQKDLTEVENTFDDEITSVNKIQKSTKNNKENE